MDGGRRHIQAFLPIRVVEPSSSSPKRELVAAATAHPKGLAPRAAILPPTYGGSRSRKLCDELAHVVGRDLGVAVHANDDIATRLPQRDVEPGWHDTARVVEQHDFRMRSLQTLDNIPRPVGRPPIRYKDFQPLRRIILSEHGAQTHTRRDGTRADGPP